MSRARILLLVAAIFAIAGVVAAVVTQRPAPGGKEPQSTGQSSQGIDPKSVGGPNDARQPPR